MCVASTAGAFALVDDRAQVASSPRTADDIVLLAAQNCPASAITIVDAVTGCMLFPDDDSEN
jgi:ferredoxin